MSAANFISRRRTLQRTAATVTVAAAVAAGGFATSTAAASPDANPHGDQYVQPSPQVMREMRAVIQALYGPQRHAHRSHARSR